MVRMDMKTTAIFALTLGAFVSATLMVLERVSDFSIAVMTMEMPGIRAAYLFWGTVGGSASIGIAVALIVNAAVYGAAAFAVLVVLFTGRLASGRHGQHTL